MGILICATAVSVDPSIKSSVAHAGRASRDCIQAAGISPSEVGVLINVGVYRDANMAEPAMAAMIQKEAGINPDYMRGGLASTSFDLMNGACGALNAVQVAGALLATGTTKHVLIVSSDAHPSNKPVAGFPYATMGGAMLLGLSSDEGAVARGFGPLRTASNKDGNPGVEGYVPWMQGAREAVSVDVHSDFEPRALALATQIAREYAASEKVDLGRTLLVSSHPTPGFAAALGKNLGVAADAVVTPEGLEGDPHTSALTWGYHKAKGAGLDARFDAVLFVAVGAGLTAACAVYRR
jgi:3-oxoacyl-[acyl-carrier-protein] synthase-3